MSELLIKKLGLDYTNIYPKSFIDSIYDRNSGLTLLEILSGFNCYFLSYTGDTRETRLQVPISLRKEGLWITYVLFDRTVVIEYYNGTDISDEYWRDSSNWRAASNFLVGLLDVSSEGNWIINGVDTNFPARGELGITPILEVRDNKLAVTYNDGKYWKILTDELAPKFRYVDASDGIEDNTVGRLQISMDLGKTWSDLTPNFTNKLSIKGYVPDVLSLPNNASLGDIYGVGPTYEDVDNPRYNIYVYTSGGWIDNGKLSSLPVGVVQVTGDSEDKVMSLKAVTLLINSVLDRMVVISELEYNDLEDKDEDKFYFIYE